MLAAATPAAAETTALITNDGVITGLLLAILGLVFYTQSSNHRHCRSFINLFLRYCCVTSCRRC